jgi:hypothetical protein
VARNNTDWYRLLDLCSVTDTLIGDEDGLYQLSIKMNLKETFMVL